MGLDQLLVIRCEHLIRTSSRSIGLAIEDLLLVSPASTLGAAHVALDPLLPGGATEFPVSLVKPVRISPPSLVALARATGIDQICPPVAPTLARALFVPSSSNFE